MRRDLGFNHKTAHVSKLRRFIASSTHTKHLHKIPPHSQSITYNSYIKMQFLYYNTEIIIKSATFFVIMHVTVHDASEYLKRNKTKGRSRTM